MRDAFWRKVGKWHLQHGQVDDSKHQQRQDTVQQRLVILISFCCKFTGVQVCKKLSRQSLVWQSYCKNKIVHFLTHRVELYCVCTEKYHCTSNPCVHGACREDVALGYSCECCPAFTGRNCDTLTTFEIPAVRLCDNMGTRDCYYTIGKVHSPDHH